ncbi:MAG: sulfotransferase [Cyanobacteria bacterium P01_H01_bin.26]
MSQLSSCPKLFVVGCPHSGTTLVASLMAEHADVVPVPRETQIYQLVYEPFIELPRWNWQRRWRSWRSILRRYGVKPLLLGFQPADIWRGILRDYQKRHRADGLVSYGELKTLIQSIRADIPETNRGLVQAEELIAAMFDRFAERHVHPGQTVLEKTPLHIRYAEQILWRFPEARIVEVIRDGRDVCVSYNALVQQKNRTPMGTANAIWQWKQCVEWGELIRNRPGLGARVHTVRYEALKADPQRCVGQLFEFANLSWDQQQIREIVKTADIGQIEHKGDGQCVSGLVGGWEQHLSEADVAVCDEIAGEQLVRSGYAVSGPR